MEQKQYTRLVRCFFVAGMLALGSACSDFGDSGGEATNARCAHCGMLVDVAPQWTSGLADAEPFDSPKCLFRWSAEHAQDAREGWVTEYYATDRRPVGELLFVIGSDVLSPMGDDLVPIEGRMRAELFVRDHGGRVLTPSEIDTAVLRSLDPE